MSLTRTPAGSEAAAKFLLAKQLIRVSCVNGIENQSTNALFMLGNCNLQWYLTSSSIFTRLQSLQQHAETGVIMSSQCNIANMVSG